MHKFMRVDAQAEVPSTDRWLGASEHGGEWNYDEPQNSFAARCINCVFGVGGFIIWVMAIIAVANSNNEDVIGNCGDGLRLIVLVQLLVAPFPFLFRMCCSMQNSPDFFKDQLKQCSPVVQYIVTILVVCVGLFVVVGSLTMVVFTYTLCTDARANPECVKALKRNSAGMVDVDLLAVMGLVYFGLEMIPICLVALVIAAVLVAGVVMGLLELVRAVAHCCCR
jgi:hypothetical protein